MLIASHKPPKPKTQPAKTSAKNSKIPNPQDKNYNQPYQKHKTERKKDIPKPVGHGTQMTQIQGRFANILKTTLN
ncbi:MAG: hypothetical protein LBJ00_06790 [Planctomycetaceae bacterium]|jgi:hypothetical protein|nr:hypothetical protein [Planctomycetaceae bacterium]